jgi:uncharacterized protein YnzC (UPF0291/DUF896 family)
MDKDDLEKAFARARIEADAAFQLQKELTDRIASLQKEKRAGVITDEQKQELETLKRRFVAVIKDISRISERLMLDDKGSQN